MTRLSINFFGNFCNSAPRLRICADDLELWHGDIVGYQQVCFDIAGTPEISLQGIGKCQGHYGIFDTYVDDQCNIVNDKYLLVQDVKLDDISMGQRWIRNLPMYTDGTVGTLTGSGFWTNAETKFRWRYPILDWIIDEKFCKFEKSNDLTITDRSGSARFNYETVQAKLRSLREILDDQDFNR